MDLADNVVTKIAFGAYHVAAVTSDGICLTWGRGNSGQLGRGQVCSEDGIGKITILDGLVADIACGESHTVALTKKGEVYSWGGG